MDTSSESIQTRISRLKVRGFRSLRDVDIKLPEPAVFLGANGAGKSNLIRLVEMLSWMLHGQKLGESVEQHGGGDDQLFLGDRLGDRQTPRMEALIEIDLGRGLNECRFALVHVPARDRLMFVQESFRYSQHGRGTQANWIELENNGTEAHTLWKSPRGPEHLGDVARPALWSICSSVAVPI